jgi:hypothetical protein
VLAELYADTGQTEEGRRVLASTTEAERLAFWAPEVWRVEGEPLSSTECWARPGPARPCPARPLTAVGASASVAVSSYGVPGEPSSRRAEEGRRCDAAATPSL